LTYFSIRLKWENPPGIINKCFFERDVGNGYELVGDVQINFS